MKRAIVSFSCGLSCLVASRAVQSAPSTAAATPPAIAHAPLRCVRAQENPLVKAGVTAQASIQTNRVYFKAHQHPDWYYIDMKALEVPDYLALLPQPLPATKQIDYYVQALDVKLQTSRTDQYEPKVTRGACRRGFFLPSGFDKGIVIGATKAGQSPIPPGFSKAGIVAFVTIAGVKIIGSALTSGAAAGGAGGSTAVATGGGISKGVLIGGAVAAGGAAGGVALALNKGETKDENPFTGTYLATGFEDLSPHCSWDTTPLACEAYETGILTLAQNSKTLTGQLMMTGDIQGCCTFSCAYPLTGTVDGLNATFVINRANCGCSSPRCRFSDVFDGGTFTSTLIENGSVLNTCPSNDECLAFRRQ
jgi:hypothetical protein